MPATMTKMTAKFEDRLDALVEVAKYLRALPLVFFQLPVVIYKI